MNARGIFLNLRVASALCIALRSFRLEGCARPHMSKTPFRGCHAFFLVPLAVMQQFYQSLVQSRADCGALLGTRDVADVDFHA